jgi:hypothetical protein
VAELAAIAGSDYALGPCDNAGVTVADGTQPLLDAVPRCCGVGVEAAQPPPMVLPPPPPIAPAAGAVLTTATGRAGTETSHHGLMFDVVARAESAIRITAISGESHGIDSPKGATDMTLFAVTGGWEQHQGSPQAWRAVGTARFTEADKQTRLVLDQPLRVEAGGRVGLYLHSPDVSHGVHFHQGDMSPVQGVGLVIHKGMYTKSATPFESVATGENRFFVGSVEYARLG